MLVIRYITYAHTRSPKEQRRGGGGGGFVCFSNQEKMVVSKKIEEIHWKNSFFIEMGQSNEVERGWRGSLDGSNAAVRRGAPQCRADRDPRH